MVLTCDQVAMSAATLHFPFQAVISGRTARNNYYALFPRLLAVTGLDGQRRHCGHGLLRVITTISSHIDHSQRADHGSA
jgi:hypothetical protein